MFRPSLLTLAIGSLAHGFTRPARWSVAIVVFAALLAVGTSPAHAVIIHFVADPINPANECPLCAAATGTGCGAFTLDTGPAPDVVTFYIVHNQAGETAAHVHGPAGVCPAAAGILKPLPVGLIKQGSYTLTAAQSADMQSSLHYTNIHTGPCGPGAIRGQIVPLTGPTEACCLPNATAGGPPICMDTSPSTCTCMGGTPQGPGSFCTAPVACCLSDGTCTDMDPLCCDDLGGVPQAAGTTCTTFQCPPPQCGPNPTGTACLPVTCPDVGDACLPRCVNFNPTSGQVVVLDCECRPDNECHVAFGPIGGPPPQCIGGCPPGFDCIETTTTLPDGTVDICCDCVPQTVYKNWVIADDFCIASACPPCTCDFDGDGVCTTFIDFAYLQGCFGPVLPGCEAADLNCDGFVNILDQNIWTCLAGGDPPAVCCPDVIPPPRPITDVQWYGSYLDPDFDPKISPDPRPIDGWLIGIHRDIPPQPCPPGSNFDMCGTISPFDPMAACQTFTPDGSVTPIPLSGFIAGCCPPGTLPGPYPGGYWRICGVFDPNCTTPCLAVPGVLCPLSIKDCETGISRPDKLIAQWFFNPMDVPFANTGKIGWDQHAIFCYGPSKLARACLMHNCAGPDEINPLNPGIFNPRPGVNYWLSIQAEVGHIVVPAPQPCCLPPPVGCNAMLYTDCINAGGIPQPGGQPCAAVDCLNPGPPALPFWIEVPTGNTVTRDFWGWHTTPPGYHNKDDAFMGMLAMGCRGEWLYQWMNHLHWSQNPYIQCADDPTKSIDMAFYLICSNGQPGEQGQVIWCQPVNPGPPPPEDPPPPDRPVPPGGIDELVDTTADLLVEVFPPGPGMVTMQASGLTRIWRDNKMILSNQTIIQTEMLSMELTGNSPLGPAMIHERNDAQSQGQIAGPAIGGHWPVDSFFDVFVEIVLPGAPPGFQNLITQGPVRVQAVGGLWELPPSNAEFQGPPKPVPIVDRSNPKQIVGRLHFVSHRVGYRGGIDIHSDVDWHNAPMECTCKGDMDENGALNALDIQGFIGCLLTIPQPVPLNCPCDCADMNDDDLLDIFDVGPFVDQLLAVPKAACPPECQ